VSTRQEHLSRDLPAGGRILPPPRRARPSTYRRERPIHYADLSILLVAVIWGSSYVVMQRVGDDVAAPAFLALRFAIAIPVVAIMAGRQLLRINRSELIFGVFFGALLFGVLILETVGVKHTTAANAGFLITLSVILVPLLERLTSHRRSSPLVFVAAAVALTGCALLLLRDGLHPQPGDLIILAAAAIRATQITLFGRRNPAQSLVNLTLVEFVTVFVLAAVLASATGQSVWSQSAHLDPVVWLLIAYLAVLGTAFAFYAQLSAARRSSSTRVGLILCTEPLFSTLFAVAAAHESLTPAQLTGGAMVVGAAIFGRAVEARTQQRRSG
jgi:drug/metabolite transporter (DMT)-like permease